MKCPIIKANTYKQGFNSNLIFNGFRGNGILWKIKEHKEMKHYGWKYFKTSKRIKWTAADYIARIESSHNQLFKLFKLI